MNTKTIFKTLAFAMTMPAMLLTTACSSEDDAIVNPENNAKKGYTLPVTVNVTRQDDGTRATYNATDKKLEFSEGDKLFVRGEDATAGKFAGTLTMVSAGTFSGTIYTQLEFSGTTEALFGGAEAVSATLLPDGYGSYNFLTVSGEGYSAELNYDYTKAFATTKAAAVEQLSFESADSYSSGFALTPQNAILNFTITGLTASTEVTALFTGDNNYVTSGTVTTDGNGTATFAMGVSSNTHLEDHFLTVGGKSISLITTEKVLAAGKVYNVSKAVSDPTVTPKPHNPETPSLSSLVIEGYDVEVEIFYKEGDSWEDAVANYAENYNNGWTNENGTIMYNGIYYLIDMYYNLIDPTAEIDSSIYYLLENEYDTP